MKSATWIRRRYKLLDLFCGAGGASMGYWIAGFDVVGVDILPQPRYPFEFISASVFDLPDADAFLAQFHAIHASPPCRVYSSTNSLPTQNKRVDYIDSTRQLIQQKTDAHYIIENVERAPLQDAIMLCGANFGLKTYRHRYFEADFNIEPPPHLPHIRPQADMGARPSDKEFMSVVGIPSDVEAARKAMGIHWMVGKELKEAVPPAYTSFIASFLRKQLDAEYKGSPLFSFAPTRRV